MNKERLRNNNGGQRPTRGPDIVVSPRKHVLASEMEREMDATPNAGKQLESLPCKHHWVLPRPGTPIANAACTHCKVQRSFVNPEESVYWENMAGEMNPSVLGTSPSFKQRRWFPN